MSVIHVQLPATELYESCSYALKMPAHLQESFANAIYLGRGASSVAWKLEDGSVFKITPDPAASSFAAWQQQNKHEHLAHILEQGGLEICLSELAHRQEAWEQWSFIVQPYYAALSKKAWEILEGVAQEVGMSQCRSRPGWCRTKNGLMAHGALAKHHLQSLQDVFEKSCGNGDVLSQALGAISALSKWWTTTKSNPGLDIDKIENWGIDVSTGKLILFDPVWGNDGDTSVFHWSAEHL